MKFLSIVGARPNFMKVAPILAAIRARPEPIEHLLVHTGQHYDHQMSDSFFTDLGMPWPDLNLEVGSSSHAQQTARVMMALEQPLTDFRPDCLIVVGDVNSTVAAALTAKKLNIDVAHVEAGLRSGDRTMPEEINRLATDAISDFLYTTDPIANANLIAEGTPPSRIHFVGNVMIDTLLRNLGKAQAGGFRQSLGLTSGAYAVLTLHRPANVDDQDRLIDILGALRDTLGDLPVIFPAHPRTRQRIAAFGMGDWFADQPGKPGIWMTDPLGYLDLLDLNSTARIILTDSGGLQEEATVLQVPCVTLRDNTERPITIQCGVNRLGGTRGETIRPAVCEALHSPLASLSVPEKWDGRAAERIVESLVGIYGP